MPLLFFLHLPIFRRFSVSSIGRSECIISKGIPFYEILPSTSDKLMINAKPIKVEMMAEDYLTVISELQVYTIELISQSFGIEQAPKLTLALRRRSHGNEMADFAADPADMKRAVPASAQRQQQLRPTCFVFPIQFPIYFP